MSAEILLSRLEKVTPRGKGKWMACCPSHADSDPSLSITETNDGRILVYCFAGCSASGVVSALGLSLTDLFPEGAIRQHMYGGTPGYRKNVIETEKKLESARLLMKICDADRAKGIRLSEATLRAEREAWMLIRQANSV